MSFFESALRTQHRALQVKIITTMASSRADDTDKADGIGCLTGFSAVAVAAEVVAAEESTSMGQILTELASDSSEDERTWGGSKKGKSANLKRDFDDAYKRLKLHYFSGVDSVYTEGMFRRRFRVSPAIFQRIYKALHGKGCFHPENKRDALGNKVIHPLVRMTAVFRTLAYGTPADCSDETWQMSETISNNALKSFCKLLIKEFGDQYLNRTPTQAERRRILAVNKRKGFPGCFASWDCKHFVWDKCPVALQGQHKGHAEGGKHTKIMEAIADDSCYFWFINFGSPGSLNDINVLDKSSIVGALLSGHLNLKTEPYTLNGKSRDWMYFLADGIYPNWAIFVKTIPKAARSSKSEEIFAAKQEGIRKDVERAFGILVKKFHLLARPIRFWDEVTIRNIVYACVILHNMCCEERVKEKGSFDLDEEDHARYHESVDPNRNEGDVVFGRGAAVTEESALSLIQNMNERFARAIALGALMKDEERHFELKRDLLLHLKSLQKKKK
jgi:Plant transposon protein